MSSFTIFLILNSFKADVYRAELKDERRVNNSLLPPAGRLHRSKSVLKDLLLMTSYFFKSSYSEMMGGEIKQ